MSRTFQSRDWDRYKMNYSDPFRALEAPEDEIAVVGEALAALREAGVLQSTDYDHAKFLAHRRAVAESFEIPWTAITPRMQRLLYAINAITEPESMIAAGVFCGNTFISNAGAAVGPGACYAARNLIGIEIIPAEAERARRNVRKIDPTGLASVVAGDAVPFVRDFAGQIDLLYLDPDRQDGSDEDLYLEVLEAGYDKMPPGSIALAHNSFNFAETIADYLKFVRDPAHFRSTVNVILDCEGLEVSVK